MDKRDLNRKSKIRAKGRQVNLNEPNKPSKTGDPNEPRTKHTLSKVHQSNQVHVIVYRASRPAWL